LKEVASSSKDNQPKIAVKETDSESEK